MFHVLLVYVLYPGEVVLHPRPFVVVKSYVKVDFKERNDNNNKITVRNVVELTYKVFDYA